MGSYCELYLAGYQIDSTKSYIHPFWSCIFKECDRASRQVHYSQYYTEPIHGNDMVPTYEYRATVAVIKNRLALLGYTLEKTKQRYSLRLNEEIAEVKESISDHSENYLTTDLKHLEQLRLGGFDYWVDIANQIMFERKIHHWNSNFENKDDDICIWAVDHNENMFLAFPEGNYGYFLRAVLEAVGNDQEVVLDITSLVYSGYYDEDEPVCENTAKAHINSTVEFEKIIVLTEGSSDSNILSESLQLLFPEVSDYFALMDFGPIKPEGGTSALERTIKSFAAAGINNKIVAIFDNDAAGLSAIQRISSIPLPSNFRIMPLPFLPLATSYPTVGPQGKTTEDVNGRACSIEMYLGKDVLINENKLTPIVWKGFEPKLNTYQGEIGEKGQVQNRFHEKLRYAQQNGMTDGSDWSGMQLIFTTLFQLVGEIEPNSSRIEAG